MRIFRTTALGLVCTLMAPFTAPLAALAANPEPRATMASGALPVTIPALSQPIRPQNTLNRPVRPGGINLMPRTSSNSLFMKSATCPLIANRPHLDLIQAIQNLSLQVQPVQNCQNNADMKKMAELAEQMKAAGSGLSASWTNPNSLLQDPQALIQFQGQVETIVNALNSIGQSLSNNSLVDSDCGRQLMSGTGILQAIGDLSTSLAPFALLGASINPSWSVGVKVILGLTGAGSLSKIISRMQDQENLKMENAENREAVIQNVCEFIRIAQRVRFLKLAQSGQIDQVTKELEGFKAETQSLLKEKSSSRVMDLLESREMIKSRLQTVNEQLKKDQDQMALLLRQTQPGDQIGLCTDAKYLAEKFSDQESFPRTAIDNFRLLIYNQEKASQSQQRILDREAGLRERLLALEDTGSSEKIQACSQIATSYMNLLQEMIRLTALTARDHEASLNQQLLADKEFSSFQAEEQRLNREVETLSRVADILSRLSREDSVIDKSEMHIQIEQLKRALFNSEGWFSASPVMAWLTFSNDQHVRAGGRFSTEWNNLTQKLYAITPAGRGNYERIIAQGAAAGGLAVLLNPMAKDISRDRHRAEHLQVLNLQVAPIGSPQHTESCRMLENVWTEWAAALDHLSAQNFFCRTIQSMVDGTVEPKIVNHCFGDVGLDGKQLRASTIQKNMQKLVDLKFQQRAKRASAKLKELQCKLPGGRDALELLD
jgi:hypothetical protein